MVAKVEKYRKECTHKIERKFVRMLASVVKMG
jgi:hypothetical protein